MSRSIRLFVSSSPDLATEREMIGQAVAELPIPAGWEIKHTPKPEEDVREAMAFVGHCDLYMVVLGADFAAPMGLEWQRALGTGRPVLAYRKRVLHSPSAQALLRQSDVTWTGFESPQELKSQVRQALAQAVFDRGEQFGLHVDDVQALLALLATEERTAKPDKRQGAERGGVILGHSTQ